MDAGFINFIYSHILLEVGVGPMDLIECSESLLTSPLSMLHPFGSHVSLRHGACKRSGHLTFRKVHCDVL